MAAATIMLNSFGTDNWNAEIYESLSLAARLAIAVKAVKTHGQIMRASYLLWRINGRTGSFFQAVDDILSGKTPAKATADEEVTPQTIEKSIESLTEIGNSLNAIYFEAQRKRLLNNSLIAGPIIALRANADRFFELAEWFELVRNPDKLDDIFANAREQRNRGEVYDLSQV